jgi:hypothetical protein
VQVGRRAKANFINVIGGSSGKRNEIYNQQVWLVHGSMLFPHWQKKKTLGNVAGAPRRTKKKQYGTCLRMKLPLSSFTRRRWDGHPRVIKKQKLS